MYSITQKAGKKQFFYALVIMLFVYITGSVINIAFKNLPILRAALIFFGGCLVVYIVYIKYASIYTYTLSEKGITVSVKAGRRSDETTVLYKKIDRVQRGVHIHMPLSKKVYTTSIFPNKNYCYIVYNKSKNLLVVEAGEEFYKKLKEYVK